VISIGEIEAELEKLAPEDLRRLALKSWKAFVAKESRPETSTSAARMIHNSWRHWMKRLRKRSQARRKDIQEMKFAFG